MAKAVRSAHPFAGAVYSVVVMFMLLFWGGGNGLFAQRVWEEDVIYLRNGSVIRGEIVSQEVGVSVTIRLREGMEMNFQTREIDKITREPARFSRISLKLYKAYMPVIFREKRLYQMVSFGLAVNETSNEPNINPSLHFKSMYHVNRWLNAGLGTGLDPYEGGLIVPLYGEVHGELFRRQVSPFYFVKGGYGIGAAGSQNHDVFTGGLMGHWGGGLILHGRNEHSEWMFSIGFKMQDTYQEFREWPQFWDWRFQVRPEPALVRGTRRYQKIVWEVTYVF